MGKINILSFEVANLIAAGEVVDRPASAIKEMIENSIDAGARHITVEINNGGITFMRISDDGCGIEPEDMPLAIKRHATSKIKDADDLDGICTLGFRGEALAAISSVSKLRIISKTHDAPIGAELVVDCGEVVDFVERGCSNGTTIIVEELFSNVPARRKFLKRDVTETTAVCANVEKIALSHPEIAFRLITDGQIKLDTAGDGKLLSSIYSVFGRDFANRLIEVNGEFDGISVSGYIGRSDNVKSNRNYQNFYINKRYVKSRTANAAIEQAYVSYIPSEKFPVCVLFISMNPGRVDVNVHPAKLEVKFSNEKPVFESIYYAVRQALEKNITRPEMSLPRTAAPRGRMSDAFVPVEREKSLKARQISIDMTKAVNDQKTVQDNESLNIPSGKDEQARKNIGNIPPEKEEDQVFDEFEELTAEEYVRLYVETYGTPEGMKLLKEMKAKDDLRFGMNDTAAEQEIADLKNEISRSVDIVDRRGTASDNFDKIAQKTEETAIKTIEKSEHINILYEKNEQKPEAPKIEYRIVGEVFNSYIIVELSEKMLIIDKHAAHERIIFEQLKRNMYSSELSSQLLMLPIEVMLMTDEVSAIEEYREELESVGFEFTSSRNVISVTALPTGIEQSAAADMFGVIADRIKSGTGKADITRNIVFEKALYQASCKAAIKAGREYPEEHQKWIVDKLMEIPDITFCPHGRPVAMEMSRKNLNRQFERT